MFGRNQVAHQELGDGNTLHIVKGSPFYTIQGEGPYTGHPAIFVRLAKCNLRCTFCDTQFDSPDDPIVTLNRLLTDIAVVNTEATARKTHLVVITGGEPLRQNIMPLCTALVQRGYYCQIETAGTLWLDNINTVAEIVCSPKTPVINANIYEHAMAFKYVIDVEQTFDDDLEYPYVPITATQPGARATQLALPRPGAPVFLSPMNCYNDERNRANKSLVASLAMRHGVIAGIQLHVELGLDEPR